LVTEYPGPYAADAAVVPVGLSMYCTNEVTVDYTIEATDGTSLRGTLVFPAGRTRHSIPVPGSFNGVLRVALENPVNADLTGESALLLQNIASAALFSRRSARCGSTSTTGRTRALPGAPATSMTAPG
jgi:hypothetical protein